jgi:hypothetical protein
VWSRSALSFALIGSHLFEHSSYNYNALDGFGQLLDQLSLPLSRALFVLEVIYYLVGVPDIAMLP